MVTVLGVGSVWLGLQQFGVGKELRAEVAALRQREREADRLAAKNRRLSEARMSAMELESLRGDHAAVVRLREEIEALRRGAEAAAKAADGMIAVQPKEYVPSILDGPMPANMWRNAGGATPAAALETALWAAAGGDIAALAGRLTFDTGVRAKAEALLAGLPEAMRAGYGSPEQFIAALTAKDVPLGNAKIYDTKYEIEGSRFLIAEVRDTDGGKTRQVQLRLRETDGEWKILVRAGVIENYAAALKGPAVGVGK
ncbi:MAG: hypothetical protein H7343_21100 [Undibacterium sp.]|nr:hypothetical protein [Opitutaceae bacterium]